MLNLIKNELLKLLNRKGIYAMVASLVFLILIAGAFIKYQENGASVPDNENWKNGLEMENNSLHKQLESMEDSAAWDQAALIKQQIALNDYRITHNLSPNFGYDMWEFVSDLSVLVELVGLFTIIVAGGIVASEYNWGTIKLLLIRPLKRGKILFSKYLFVLIFAILMLILLFGFSSAVGALLFGTPEKETPFLTYFNGHVVEQPMWVFLLLYYLLKSVNMLLLATMAFMISAVFRSSSLSIGLSIFLMFTGGQITRLVAMKFEWAKYILFANTNLIQYFEGIPLIKGMTFYFSVTVLLIYLILFLSIAFAVFNKRDVSI